MMKLWLEATREHSMLAMETRGKQADFCLEY